MKYYNKNTNKLKKEMARRRGKKIIGKSGERLNGLDNTMAQQTGQGELARSSAIATGKISNAGEKLSNKMDIDKITDDARVEAIKKLRRAGKISKEDAQKKIEEIRNKEMKESIEFFEENGLKVNYNNKTMNIKEFFKKSKTDSELNSFIEQVKSLKESEAFIGTFVQYIIEKFDNGKFVVNKEVNNVS